MLIHGEGDRHGQPYRLLPWQREFAWRWFELDPLDGPEYFWYLEALIGAERGAVKTEFLGALGHVEMAGPEGLRRPLTPIVHIAAAAYLQAGELFRQAQIMAGGAKGEEIPAAPLFGLYDVYDGEILFKSGQPGRMQRIAAVAGTNEGGKSTLFLADELAEWTGRRDRVYTVVSAATTKRTPPGRAIGISMAGAGKGHVPARDTDPLLWRQYVRGLSERSDPLSRFLMDWVSADEKWDLDDPDDVRAALAQMRGADITWSIEVRAREILSRKIQRHEAKRLYLCQWVERSVDSWLNELPGAWEECGEPGAAAHPPDGSDVVVAVDMALHQDSVGVVVAGRMPNGHVGWHARAWAPENGKIDHLDVFGTIAGAYAKRWRIQAVTYDPRFFELPANILEDQGFNVVEFPQSPERLIACDGLLYELVRTHELEVDGEDLVLAEHANNAAWRDTERGRYLSKGKALGHMDLIRAGAMATWELLAPDPEEETEPHIW